MLIAASIGAFILAAVLSTFIFSVKGFRAIENYATIHADGRLAIDVMARDMRAVSDVTSFTSSSIYTVIPTAFNSSGNVISNKNVRYWGSGGALYRYDSSTGKTTMLATNILSLTFSLYDRIGSNTTTLSVAKGVQLDMKLRKYVQGQTQTEDYLSARLTMRNKP